MKEPLVKLDHVCIEYRVRESLFRSERYQPLTDLNFSIFKGETVGIIGRNGSGKSTMLRVISGLIRPKSGTITTIPNLKISHLSLQLGFDPQLNGLDNIIFGSLLMGLTVREARRNIPDIVEFADLGDFINKPVRTYSSGMKARLAFSVAISVKPDLMLIDEVLGVGDASFQKKSGDALRSKLTSEQAVVLVSHNKEVIKSLCNRAVWIDGGVIRVSGEPKHVIAQYELLQN